jgi:hypothetical protein
MTTAYSDAIFRPGGTASGNVFTTWATALAAVQAWGTGRLLVDSSLAVAQVASGTYHFYGSISICPYAWGTVGNTDPNATLTLLDGATLVDVEGIDGPITVQCTCTTTKAFDFTWGIGEVLFRMTFGAEIQLLTGATVAPFQIPQPVANSILGELDILLHFDPVLDSSAVSTVPMFDLLSTNNSLTSALGVAAYNGISIYGNMVRGGSGGKSQVLWDVDCTIPAFSSSLFSGILTTTQLSKSSMVSYTPTAMSNWGSPGPTNLRAAMDRVAQALNTLGAKP